LKAELVEKSYKIPDFAKFFEKILIQVAGTSSPIMEDLEEQGWFSVGEKGKFDEKILKKYSFLENKEEFFKNYMKCFKVVSYPATNSYVLCFSADMAEKYRLPFNIVELMHFGASVFPQMKHIDFVIYKHKIWLKSEYEKFIGAGI